MPADMNTIVADTAVWEGLAILASGAPIPTAPARMVMPPAAEPAIGPAHAAGNDTEPAVAAIGAAG